MTVDDARLPFSQRWGYAVMSRGRLGKETAPHMSVNMLGETAHACEKY